MIATDRISAFDSVLPCGIPDKGAVLNQLSAFWFEKTADIIPNHMVKMVDDVKWLNQTYGKTFPESVAGRSMVVKKAERIDIECVVRGYISGSAWAEYQEKGTVCGVHLSDGLVESEELPQPIFTPTTKAESGHDEPITMREMKNLVGEPRAAELMEKSMAMYRYAHDYAMERGIIIADTKMEFGLVDGQVILIDELLTPDSSRFWDANLYRLAGAGWLEQGTAGTDAPRGCHRGDGCPLPRGIPQAHRQGSHGMKVVNRNDVETFVTKDSSEIREILAPANSEMKNQSLAEAGVSPGRSTEEHFHPLTEEIYYILEGRGRIRVEGEEREVGPGDGIAILPGQKHRIWNTGRSDLVFLCCCSPAYSHDDTVITG
jgi:phosphoribosylaminoimidazole-succinocarboxamide synthase